MSEASQTISGGRGGGIIMAVLGGLVAFTGVIMVLVGVYRALSKIDARPVPVPNQMWVNGPNMGSDGMGPGSSMPAQPPFLP